MHLVAAAIVRHEGRVLVARRDAQQPMAGFWEFPGGKVDHGESVEDCLVRELYEELGVVARTNRILCESFYHYDHGSFKIVAIETFLESHDFDLRTHDSIDWLWPNQLLSINLLPGDIPIAKFLTEDHK